MSSQPDSQPTSQDGASAAPAPAPAPTPAPTSTTPVPTHEPPWSGWIETTGDALIILEAARRGLIPRVTRRLVDAERKMITSGSVFVFDEEESGIKRWTDGLFWSASRILGNFLLYRETDKRGAGHKTSRSDTTAEDALHGSGTVTSTSAGDNTRSTETHSLSRPRSETSRLGIDRQRERSLVGSLTNSDKFKPGGMVKKTFSLTIKGVAQHLISYYKIEDVEAGRLRPPSSYPELASLDISADYLEKTHFRNPPKVEIGVDGVPRYRGEADDVEPSPHVINAAIGSAPLLSEPTDVGAVLSKRNKRYDPYISPTRAKRRAKPARSQPTSPTTDASGPFSSVSATQAYSMDPTASAMPQQQQQQQQYPAASYAIAPQYGYQLGFPTVPHTLPPAYPSTSPSHSHLPTHTQPGVPSGTPFQQPIQAYASPSLDTQSYYPYYQTGFASYWAALPPTYSQTTQHASAPSQVPHMISSPASHASEKTEPVDIQPASAAMGGFDVGNVAGIGGMTPVIES